MSTKKQQFRVKPLAAAVGLAMAVPFMISSAFAVTQGNLPVNGVVATGSATFTVNSGSAGNFSQTAAATVTVSANNTVIDWNATDKSARLNPDTSGSYGGFNVGSNATLTINGSGYNVLNVDTTGNPSDLYGTIKGTANVFVANANGIVVGNGATIRLPVIGLLGSNTTKFDTSGNLPISFSGTSGSVDVNSGAVVSGTLIVAGSGTVNVDSTNPNLLLPSTVIGGASGTLATSGAFTPAYSDPAGGSSVTLSSAPTTVNLAIGSATSPIQQGAVGTVYANGDINNSGDITANQLYFTGTLSNSGVLQGNSIAGLSGSNSSGIYNNSTLPAFMGNIANSGTITNGGSNNGFNVDIAGSFVNTGTISVGGTSASNLNSPLTVIAGSINNSGTINLVTTNAVGSVVSSSVIMQATSGSLTMGGTLNAATLDHAGLIAPNMAGNSLNVNTTISATNVALGGTVYLSGFNVNVNAPVTAGTSINYGDIHAMVGGNAGPQMGMLSIASTGTLNAVGTTHGSSLVSVFADSAPYNVNLAGSVSGNTVSFSGAYNVQGAGLITADNLTIDAMGSVNNPNGGGNASNGWLTNSLNVTPYSNGTAGTTNVSLTADGSAIQMFNVAVKGNATYNTGATSTFTDAGFSNAIAGTKGFYGPAANAGSHLVVQASGNMTLLPGTSATDISSRDAFVFPGLVVADAGGSLTAATPIDNGMYQNAPAGYGIFLQGSSINLSSPIYTNGNSWVNFSTTPSGIMPPIYDVQQITGTASGVNSYVKTATVPGTNQNFTDYSKHIRKYTQFTAG